ncbi:MAG TPA: hypothetical protein VMU83_14855 [Hanamia sp.]|nr:hypothetical protein [Hanamia sp.]
MEKNGSETYRKWTSEGHIITNLAQPGNWIIGLEGFGETLPYHENCAYLDKDVKDKWNLTVLAIDAAIRDNEKKCL